MKKAALAEAKDRLCEYLRDAAQEAAVITRHGKPAGVLIGFATEDDRFDYRLENDPTFLARIEQARTSLRAGPAIPWRDVQQDAESVSSDFVVRERPASTRRRKGYR